MAKLQIKAVERLHLTTAKLEGAQGIVQLQEQAAGIYRQIEALRDAMQAQTPIKPLTNNGDSQDEHGESDT